jgi:acyl carrier protein phosphodiesterase
MNFLAHLYLSGDDNKLMIGNFIGDFVKGKNALEKFEPEIIRGIEMHRRIDAFTDTHPIVTESKNRLRPKYRHYAGVIVDVFYDHFLARNWSSYHPEVLPDYAARVYKLIESFDPILPLAVKNFLPYMVRGNWLVNYAQVEGIQRALTGMARRTPYDSKMDESVMDLVKHYDAFKNEFDSFFPELSKHAEKFAKGDAV